MRSHSFFVPATAGTVVLVGTAFLNPHQKPAPVPVEKPQHAAPQLVMAETYNAVTRIHFTNVAVHKGSHNRNLVKRRFRADVKYWLMDSKYYDRGDLSIGNPTLVDFVRKLGSKDLPANEPTTLPTMAHEIARAVLDRYPIVQKVEVRLIHFSRGLEVKDEAEDNHVVNVVLRRGAR